MALAAAVLKAVNSSLYGLSGRVQSVQQSITYLGIARGRGHCRWSSAAGRVSASARARRDMATGSAARRDHQAGWLKRCRWMPGRRIRPACLKSAAKAVLLRHAPDHYRSMLRAADNDVTLCELEAAGFGVSHDVLGAALCESWGLSGAAVACVRHHVQAQADLGACRPR